MHICVYVYIYIYMHIHIHIVITLYKLCLLSLHIILHTRNRISEIIVDFHLFSPMDFQWHFPTESSLFTCMFQRICTFLMDVHWKFVQWISVAFANG